MELDLASLGTFNRLVTEGAHSAADSATRMTGIETEVEVTRINFLPAADIRKELETDLDDYLGVHISFDGLPTGHAIIAFEEESARGMVDSLLPDHGDSVERMDRSALKEVGNITVSGFIDGWANYLETTIDISPPDYVERGDFDRFWSDLEDEVDGHVLSFNSQIRATEGNVDFVIYILPDNASMERALRQVPTDERDDHMDVRKLDLFNRMTVEGASTITENLYAMTGIDAEAEITNLHFMKVEDIPDEVGDREVVGILLHFTGVLTGYLAILFDHDSARKVADAMLDGSEGADAGEMQQSALREMGNIMASSLVDGWANALGTEIDISVPEYVDDIGRAVMDPVVIRLAQRQQFAFTFDTHIESPETNLSCRVYALPESEGLKTALDALGTDD